MGMIGAVWIAHSVMTLITAPQTIPIISKFGAFDKVARSIVASEGTVELPEGLYYAVGFFLYVLALAIAASLAKVLITVGANLVGQESTPILNWLRDEMRRFKEHWEKRHQDSQHPL
jgi:hypothetical protein